MPKSTVSRRGLDPTYGKIYVPGELEYMTVLDSTRDLPRTFGGGNAGERDQLVEYAKG